MFAYGEPVDFFSPKMEADPYSGETTANWGSPQFRMTIVCGIEPIGSEEPPDTARQAVITGFRLYFDSFDPIQPAWRAFLRGSWAEVAGYPAQWMHPMTGWQAGSVLEVRVIDG